MHLLGEPLHVSGREVHQSQTRSKTFKRHRVLRVDRG
jgi:hypothetical protein